MAVMLLVSAFARSAEADYVRQHCQGVIEHVLPDNTRVDCLTDSHAWEFDRGHKWAEGVGQALHYAANTGRRAGVVLIIKGNSDWRGYIRARRLVDHYGLPIDLEIVEPE